MAATVFVFPSPDRQKRITDREHLIKPIATAIWKKLFAIQLDDLQGVGQLALVRACDDSTAMQPEAVEPYIHNSIRFAILDDVRNRISRRECVVSIDRKGSYDTGSSSRALDLRRALEELPDVEQRLMELRLEGQTQAEAGRTLGITRRAAGKIETRAIEMLKARMNPVMVKAA